ncbi:serine hydrolase domain-containing protein [Paenibacillus sp. sgz500992]|uniref:serine hydrolase domain-containing protein n=1 Tax=Paenibacillus sp. sgz500992 TaxID=3242476 RepID=UPI0036D3F296
MTNIQFRLEQYMQTWEDAERFSGTVLVAQGDHILLEKGYGYGNHEYAMPNTPSTIYNIGSITKLFTAAAVMQLYDRQKLRLNEPMETYFPGYRHGDRITIHHLLSSTSGIPDYTELSQYSPRDRLSAESIREWLNHELLQGEPGQQAQKSNSNFVFLARIVEIVSGMEIGAYYEKFLFAPLGLKHTGISCNEEILTNKAYGYSCSGEGVVCAEYYDMSGAFGSGFLYSTAADLFTWIQALGSGTVISKEAYDRMLTPYGYLWYLEASAGYGCCVKGEPVEEMFMDGNIYGYTCTLQRYISGDFTVIVLSNNDASPVARLVKGLRSILYTGATSIIVKPELADTADYEQYRHFAGVYCFPPMGWHFTIHYEESLLYVDRLFNQEFKKKKFQLKLVADTAEAVVLACVVCESTFTFHKATEVKSQQVTYSFDTLNLPYERSGG